MASWIFGQVARHLAVNFIVSESLSLKWPWKWGNNSNLPQSWQQYHDSWSTKRIRGLLLLDMWFRGLFVSLIGELLHTYNHVGENWFVKVCSHWRITTRELLHDFNCLLLCKVLLAILARWGLLLVSSLLPTSRPFVEHFGGTLEGICASGLDWHNISVFCRVLGSEQGKSEVIS
jgi:hypothetical protein